MRVAQIRLAVLGVVQDRDQPFEIRIPSQPELRAAARCTARQRLSWVHRFARLVELALHFVERVQIARFRSLPR